MILVTGAAGYIGTRVMQTIPQNKRIGIDNYLKQSKTNKEIIRADISNFKDVEYILNNYDIDCIINLAAVVGDPACKKYRKQADISNIYGVKTLVECAQKNGNIRIIQASTCSVYGYNESIVDETSAINPLSYYAETKIEAERIVRESGLHYVIARFSTAMGWSDSPRFDLTVNEFVKEAYYKRTIEVYRPDDYRPYCHVADIADILYEMAENTRFLGSYNVGMNDNNLTKKDIIEAIRKHENVKCDIVSKQDDQRNYRVDFSHLKRTSRKNRFYSLDATVEEIFEKLKEENINADSRMYRSDYLDCEEG